MGTLGPVRFTCPCCRSLTLPEAPPGTFFICPVCFWEDDDVQFGDHSFGGGANDVSLDEARRNYDDFRASDRRFAKDVRPPLADEMPSP